MTTALLPTLVLAGAFALAAALVPLASRIARRHGILDAPGPRKVHAQSTPRVGGIAVWAAFTAVVVAGYLGVPLLAKLDWVATRLAGSNDLYEHSGRRPYASINFITAHDGFTLHDLVSYNEKHNEANGEDNRDGENHNLSWNSGVEGPTDDPAIRRLREQQKQK